MAADKEDGYDQMIDRLNEENSQLRKTISQKEKEIEECKLKLLSTAVVPEQAESQQGEQTAVKDQRTQQENQEEPNGMDVYASMSHLLSPLASASESRIDLEQKAKHLSIMLEESEERVAALRAQEKVLKDEIRKLDSFDRRQNLNIEYLKNVLLKFLQSENKEFMVPVLAKLLLLDPSETEELRKSVRDG
ncbi:hypothetical protein BX666DRAFT_1998790 [Dichotomocladium elegans]|nr:hypothetical protein BX666DRAFT_1998790 [Dichotomocladium elegans]